MLETVVVLLGKPTTTKAVSPATRVTVSVVEVAAVVTFLQALCPAVESNEIAACAVAATPSKNARTAKRLKLHIVAAPRRLARARQQQADVISVRRIRAENRRVAVAFGQASVCRKIPTCAGRRTSGHARGPCGASRPGPFNQRDVLRCRRDEIEVADVGLFARGPGDDLPAGREIDRESCFRPAFARIEVQPDEIGAVGASLETGLAWRRRS